MIDKNTIDRTALEKQALIFIDFLKNDAFFEAHEALEEIWFPLRFEKSDEVRFIRACINAAVSFELVKRGRAQASKKPWGFYEKHLYLFDTVNPAHETIYQNICDTIELISNQLKEPLV